MQHKGIFNLTPTPSPSPREGEHLIDLNLFCYATARPFLSRFLQRPDLATVGGKGFYRLPGTKGLFLYPDDSYIYRDRRSLPLLPERPEQDGTGLTGSAAGHALDKSHLSASQGSLKPQNHVISFPSLKFSGDRLNPLRSPSTLIPFRPGDLR